jgi:hypothetical protein
MERSASCVHVVVRRNRIQVGIARPDATAYLHFPGTQYTRRPLAILSPDTASPMAIRHFSCWNASGWRRQRARISSASSLLALAVNVNPTSPTFPTAPHVNCWFQRGVGGPSGGRSEHKWSHPHRIGQIGAFRTFSPNTSPKAQGHIPTPASPNREGQIPIAR